MRHIGCYFLLLLTLANQSECFYDPHCNGKTVIVHLFEWRWSSIAAECERFLADAGYCGVQVSIMKIEFSPDSIAYNFIGVSTK